MSRVVKESNNDLNFWLDGLRLSQKSKVYEGYGSSGCVVGTDEGDKFLRVPKTATPDYLRAYQLAGVEALEGLFTADKDEIRNIPFDPNSLRKDVLLAGVPDSITGMAMILEANPSPRQLTHIINENDHPLALTAYENLGIRLREMHERRVELTPNELKDWNIYGSLHPIYGRERFNEVADYLRDREPSLSNQLTTIQELMIGVATHGIQAHDVRRIHGDAWRDNVSVTRKGRVHLFDNAVAYGPRGYDVGFAVGDQILRWLAGGEQQAFERASALIEAYDSPDVFKEIHVPFAFKCIVGAAFDGYSDENAAGIRELAVNILQEKVRTPSHALTFEEIQRQWERTHA